MSQGDEHRRAAAAPPQILEERRVDDLETLRMLTDPLRLAILGALPTGADEPPKTVKEIAEELDEGQTKLYRHIKQLEESGLIHVAETRVVSGIIEKRYRPSQRRLTVESDLLRMSQGADEYNDAIVAIIEAIRGGLSADLRAGRVVLDKPESGPDLSIKVGGGKARMTPEHYERVRALLHEAVEDMDADDGKPGTIPVVLQVLLYSTAEPPSKSTADQNTENPPSTKSS
jgi:DNA-binding transcriptional ArsR family regulator